MQVMGFENRGEGLQKNYDIMSHNLYKEILRSESWCGKSIDT